MLALGYILIQSTDIMYVCIVVFLFVCVCVCTSSVRKRWRFFLNADYHILKSAIMQPRVAIRKVHAKSFWIRCDELLWTSFDPHNENPSLISKTPIQMMLFLKDCFTICLQTTLTVDGRGKPVTPCFIHPEGWYSQAVWIAKRMSGPKAAHFFSPSHLLSKSLIKKKSAPNFIFLVQIQFFETNSISGVNVLMLIEGQLT